MRKWTTSSTRPTIWGVISFYSPVAEPLVRKDDIIRLCESHSDCQFTAFTNATLIDEAFADEMLRVKNFIPAISVEGFEESTDFRRGSGTFKRIEKAMAVLKEKRLPFGLSCCYTSQNTQVIGSEEYFRSDGRMGQPNSVGCLPICRLERTLYHN